MESSGTAQRVADIPGFPGYRVTADGRIQSVWRKGTTEWAADWRDLSPSSDAKGYLGLTICSRTRRRKVRVHRLVAEAFHPNPENLPCVRHLDGNNRNNAADNLAWGTYADNEHDKIAHGTWDMRRGGGKLTAAQREDAVVRVARGELHADVARLFGVSRPTISRLVSGKTWRQAA